MPTSDVEDTVSEQLERLTNGPVVLGDRFLIHPRDGRSHVMTALDLTLLRPYSADRLWSADAAGIEAARAVTAAVDALEVDSIPRTRAVGRASDGRAYLVTTARSPVTLDTIARTPSSVPLDTTLKLARETAAVLDLVHAAGIVHGALTLELVSIERGNMGVRVMVAGFGIHHARSSHPSQSEITQLSAYSAPDAEVTPASDVYSLAAMIHHLLYGIPPGSTATSALTRLPHALAAALRSAPSQRPKSAGELVAALRRELAIPATDPVLRAVDATMGVPDGRASNVPERSAEDARRRGARALELAVVGGIGLLAGAALAFAASLVR